MPQYHVNSEEIQQASIAVYHSIDQMRTAVQAMYTNLTALEGSWQGSAATQFESVIQQWRTSQHAMESTLQNIQQALSQAAAVYADAEVQASQLFS
ncbi:WXG100 family type VII secretion target [Alloscardovia macacae]|uniref:ESAT-6-like protein n=1 Tax=Alloscardovia macacae TaxID=1160091 RepID=A0A261F3E0_9BIFI|nr:WXG100 family type VII secretion target [Alloscardovia macacae]OZG53632.1 type VII secretion protein [Alloscardovia macacae]